MHDGDVNDAAVRMCAEGESRLQAALHAGLGHSWLVRGMIGWDPAGAPHPLLLGAVTLARNPPIDALLAASGTICDSYAELTPHAVPGRTAQPAPPWMLRRPAPLSHTPSIDEVHIRRVTADAEVIVWERVVFQANRAEPAMPGELHPPGSQRYPGLALLLAEREGEPVGAALGLVSSSCVTVSAVAVLPPSRRAGIGTALTAAVLALAPDKPATLSTSRLGAGIYRRLGFQEVGSALHWR